MEGEKEVYCTASPINLSFLKNKSQESVRFSETGARQLLQGE
jgi:hypothetical protein